MNNFERMNKAEDRRARIDTAWSVIGDAFGGLCLFVMVAGMLFIGAVLI